MIKKAQRVPRQSIRFILTKGGEIRSQFFIIRFRENQQPLSRFRVIVSKKIEKSAVKRNRLRRQIYEILRLNSENNTKHYDSILIPKKNIPKENFSALKSDINQLLTNHGQI